VSDPDTAALAARLIALRDDALAQLAESDGIDAGLLRIVADAGAALAAIDRAGEVPAQ
jgi:hypothetical protein